MRHLMVNGTRQIGGILFYVTVDGTDMAVSERMYDKVGSSLRQGDVWIYDTHSKQLIKYGTQLSLFEQGAMDEAPIDAKEWYQ